MFGSDLKQAVRDSAMPGIVIVAGAALLAGCARAMFGSFEGNGVLTFVYATGGGAPLLDQLCQIFTGASLASLACAGSIIGGMTIAFLFAFGARLAGDLDAGRPVAFGPRVLVAAAWLLVALVAMTALAGLVLTGAVSDLQMRSLGAKLARGGGLSLPLAFLMLWSALVMQAALVFASVGAAHRARRRGLVRGMALLVGCLIAGAVSMHFGAQLFVHLNALSPDFGQLNACMARNAGVNGIIAILGCVATLIALKGEGRDDVQTQRRAAGRPR